MQFQKPSIPWTALNGGLAREGTVVQWMDRRSDVRLNRRDRDREVSTAENGVARAERNRPREERFGFCWSQVDHARKGWSHERPRAGKVTQRRSGGDRARDGDLAAQNGPDRDGIVKVRAERCSPHDGGVAARKNRRERALKGHAREGAGMVRCSGRGKQSAEARQREVVENEGWGLHFVRASVLLGGERGWRLPRVKSQPGRREIPWHGGPLCHSLPNKRLLPTQPRFARPGSRAARRSAALRAH